MVGTMHAFSTSEVPCHSEGHSSSCIVKETMQKPPSFCVPWNIEAQPSFIKYWKGRGRTCTRGLLTSLFLSSGFLVSTIPPLSIERKCCTFLWSLSLPSFFVEEYLKECVSNYRIVSKTLNYKIVLSITSHLMGMFNSSKIKSFIHQSIILSL